MVVIRRLVEWLVSEGLLVGLDVWTGVEVDA